MVCPKVYFVKSIYPLRDLFFSVLHSAHDFFRYADMNFLSKSGFTEDTSENEVIDWLVSRERDVTDWTEFERGVVSLSHQLKTPEPSSAQQLDFLGIPLHLEVPSEKIIDQFGNLQNASEVISAMNYIDYMFVFASILHERTVIFVSEERRLIGLAIQLFSSIIQPLNWPYPVIYSMPENCLDILGSPVPLIAGLLGPSKKVMDQIVPEYAAISRETIYVLLDDRFILAGKSTVSQTCMPRFNKSIKELHESIKHLFASTGSSSINYGTKSREFSRKSSSKPSKAASKSLSKKKLDSSGSLVLKNYLQGLKATLSVSLAVSLPDDIKACEREVKNRFDQKEQKFLDAFLQTQTFAFSLPQLKSQPSQTK